MEDYLHDVALCQHFAARNREKMAEILLEKMGFEAGEAFHTVHNYVDVEEMILRKGAVSAKKGEMLLICTDNALFKELLAQDNNKKMLAEAIRQVAGKSYRLGLRRAVAVQKEKNDPLSQLLTAARKAEVPVNEN
jgi:RNA-splicing ligase RtcB